MKFLRRRRWMALAALTAAAVLIVGAGSAGAANDEAKPAGDSTQYTVTITNLTKGQVLSPSIVASHSQRMDPIFETGMAASTELAQVAEDAVNDPLVDMLSMDPHVMDVATLDGPIMPGESGSVMVDGRRLFTKVSVLGMLVTTNDAFYAATDLSAPFFGANTAEATAYDAGSEANNEDCDFIPGPPCGNPEVRATEDAEGYVYIHSGVHGGA
ncbi:MAG: spondin domain-containing protein, partial [Chloroflexota bacterium]